MEKTEEIYPRTPARIEAFATFFKKYMSVSSVVTAALPIPVTALGLIPTYQFQTKILSTLTSLFCFLILAFIFFSRHQLARFMFPEVIKKPSTSAIVWRYFVRLLPLVLIVASLYFVFKYQALLTNSISAKRTAWALPSDSVADLAILERSHQSQLPEASLLMIYYLGIFMTAEAAFILMAIKEYLQDLLHLSEVSLIMGPKAGTPPRQRTEAKKDSMVEPERASG